MVDRLLELDPRLWLSRSWTTRPRRATEASDAYTFVDRDTFLNRVADGGFVEHTEFQGTGHFYGTPTLDPPPGRDAILEIELDGAHQIKARHPDAKLILVVPPSRQAQASRLRARGDNEDHVARRVELGAEEERKGRAVADAVVVNDDVERAAHEVAGILARYRHTPTSPT